MCSSNTTDTVKTTKSDIVNLYGEDIFKSCRVFDKLCCKKEKILTDIAFLSRCRDKNILPKFLKLKEVIKGRMASKIYQKAGMALLRDRIHAARRRLDAISREIMHLRLYLSQTIAPILWDKFDAMVMGKAANNAEKVKKTQIKKFEGLSKSTNLGENEGEKNMVLQNNVINLSDHALSDAENRVLMRGLNFAVTPTSIPIEEIIVGVEAAVRLLPSELAETTRQDIARLIGKAKPIRQNIPKEERRAIKELHDNTEIVVIKADKGNSTVIMNSEDYEEKMEEFLKDGTYRKIQKDPTNTVVRKTAKLLNDYDKDIKQKLTVKAPIPPRIYGLPKIHKPGVPLRPIVSSIDSPTYLLAKFLAKNMTPLIGNNSSFIKDSTHFVSLIQELRTSPEDLLVSFDVVSLFTNVPLDEVLKLVKNELNADMVPLIEHCLTTTYFNWKGEFFEQTEGVAMGSPLSPVVANLYMDKFEVEALDTAEWKPSYWFRYVDDTFVVWPHGRDKLQDFLTHLNSRHKNIQFTMEVEEDRCLAFLDVLVRRKEDGSLGHSVHRKSTHTDRYLHQSSNHHQGQKLGIIKTLFTRANRLADGENLSGELLHLKKVFQGNGYNNWDIKRALKTKKRTGKETMEEPKATACIPYIAGLSENIGRILNKNNIRTVYRSKGKIGEKMRSVKGKIPPLCSCGVYSVPCGCGKVYVGESCRAITTRLKEHDRCIRLGQFDKSAIAQHAWDCDKKINFGDTKLLAKNPKYFERIIREALEIKKNENNFNRDGGYQISVSWNAALKTLPKSIVRNSKALGTYDQRTGPPLDGGTSGPADQ